MPTAEYPARRFSMASAASVFIGTRAQAPAVLQILRVASGPDNFDMRTPMRTGQQLRVAAAAAPFVPE